MHPKHFRRYAAGRAAWMALAVSLPAQTSQAQRRTDEGLSPQCQGDCSRHTSKSYFPIAHADGRTIRHDARFNYVDEYKPEVKYPDGFVELNFRDCYKFDIAAYETGETAGPRRHDAGHVERKWNGRTGASLVAAERTKRHGSTNASSRRRGRNRQMYKKRISPSSFMIPIPISRMSSSPRIGILDDRFHPAFRIRRTCGPRRISETQVCTPAPGQFAQAGSEAG